MSVTKTVLAAGLAGLLAATAPRPAAAFADLPGPVLAEVVDVIDGDSLRVRARIWLQQEVETIVRVQGIDAPELRGRCPQEVERAKEARAALLSTVAGENYMVALHNIMQDKYGGRVLADILSPDTGQNLIQPLIDQTLVRVYTGGARQGWCP